jgi:hypothetical protein
MGAMNCALFNVAGIEPAGYGFNARRNIPITSKRTKKVKRRRVCFLYFFENKTVPFVHYFKCDIF